MCAGVRAFVCLGGKGTRGLGLRYEPESCLKCRARTSRAPVRLPGRQHAGLRGSLPAAAPPAQPSTPAYGRTTPATTRLRCRCGCARWAGTPPRLLHLPTLAVLGCVQAARPEQPTASKPPYSTPTQAPLATRHPTPPMLSCVQTACPASADSCRGVAGMAGHPLQTRSCGLFGLSKPSCMWVEQRLRPLNSWRACRLVARHGALAWRAPLETQGGELPAKSSARRPPLSRAETLGSRQAGSA